MADAQQESRAALSGPRFQMLGQRQALGGKFGRVVRYAGDVAANPGQTLHQTCGYGSPAAKATTVASLVDLGSLVVAACNRRQSVSIGKELQ